MYAPRLPPCECPKLQSFQLDIKQNKQNICKNIQIDKENKTKINYGKISLSSNGRG